jgi:hypothetical protein
MAPSCPGLCDGTSAVAKADTAFASVGQPTEPCLETHNAAPAEYVGQAALVLRTEALKFPPAPVDCLSAD